MSHEQRALKNAKKREARASTNNSKGNPNRPTEHQYSEDVVPTGVSVVTAVENTEPRSGNMDSDDIGQGWLFRNDSATLTRTGRSDLLKRAACVSTGDAAGTMQGPPAKPNIDSVNSRCAPEQSSEHRNRMLTRSATRGGRLLTENTLSAGAGVHGDMDADDGALEGKSN
ncbi:unnamed protein product [Urochloa humidicola]